MAPALVNRAANKLAIPMLVTGVAVMVAVGITEALVKRGWRQLFAGAK